MVELSDATKTGRPSTPILISRPFAIVVAAYLVMVFPDPAPARQSLLPQRRNLLSAFVRS